MFGQNISFCFDESLNSSIILKRNIRINSSKLPSDFFISRQITEHQSKRQVYKKSVEKDTTRQTNTPTLERDFQLPFQRLRPSLMSQRKIETARANMSKDDTLIHEVISTARNLRRVLRKKSLEMGHKSVQQNAGKLRLPKLKIKGL